MKSRDWLLLIGVLLAGLAIHEIGQLKRPLWLDYSLGRYSGSYLVFKENKEIVVPDKCILEITGNVGTISIRGTMDKKAFIKWEKQIYETRKTNAEKIAQMLTLTVNKNDGRIQLMTNTETLENTYGKSIKNNYEIQIPVNTDLHIQNKMGNLIIENMNSFADISNSFGDSTIKNSGNQFTIEHSFGVLTISNINGLINANSDYSKIEASRIRGKFKLVSKYAKIAMNDINGLSTLDLTYGIFEGSKFEQEINVTLKHTQLKANDSGAKFIINSAYSTIALASIHNDITISSKQSPVSLDDIDGRVYIDANFKEITLHTINGWCEINANHTAIRAQKVFAGLKINNSFEDVVLEDVYGKVIINNHHSDVIFTMHQAKYINLSADVKYGNIEMEIPENYQFNLTGTAYSGDIINYYSKESFIINERKDDTKIMNKNPYKSGPIIILSTNYGDITLKLEAKTTAWISKNIDQCKEKIVNKAQNAQLYVAEKIINEVIEYSYSQFLRITCLDTAS